MLWSFQAIGKQENKFLNRKNKMKDPQGHRSVKSSLFNRKGDETFFSFLKIELEDCLKSTLRSLISYEN